MQIGEVLKIVVFGTYAGTALMFVGPTGSSASKTTEGGVFFVFESRKETLEVKKSQTEAGASLVRFNPEENR